MALTNAERQRAFREKKRDEQEKSTYIPPEVADFVEEFGWDGLKRLIKAKTKIDKIKKQFNDIANL